MGKNLQDMCRRWMAGGKVQAGLQLTVCYLCLVKCPLIHALTIHFIVIY